MAQKSNLEYKDFSILKCHHFPKPHDIYTLSLQEVSFSASDHSFTYISFARIKAENEIYDICKHMDIY